MSNELQIVLTPKGKVNISGTIRKFIETRGPASHQDVATAISQVIGQKVSPSTVERSIESGECWAQRHRGEAQQ